MTTKVDLNWQESAQGSNQYVATFQINGTADQNWNVPLNSTNVNAADRAIKPRFLTVDNIFNGVPVSATFGPFTFSTPAYQRLTFTLPDNTSSVQLNLASGVTNIVVSESNVNPDVTNNLLVQQTAVKTLIYRYNTYNVTTNQSADDLNTNTNFAHVVADMQFNLLSIAGDGVGNGWTQWIKNTGTKNVQIFPNGGDLINGFFSAATPLTLSPGDGGLLTSDGANWYFAGKLSIKTATIALNNSVTASVTHNFGKRPELLRIVLTCLAANNGYAVGDTIEFSMGAANSAGASGITPFSNTTTAGFIVSSARCVAVSKATASVFQLAVGQWNIDLTAVAWWYG